MKNKGHIFVFLAVLLCSGVFVSPVFAYDLLNTGEVDGTTLGSIYQVINIGFQHEKGVCANVTHFEYEGLMQIDAGTALSGEYSGQLHEGANHRGNFSATWTFGDLDSEGKRLCTIIIDFDDTPACTQTDEVWTIYQLDAMSAAMRGAYNIYTYRGADAMNPLPWSSNNNSAFIVSAQSYIINGTHRTYGGTSVSTPEASFTCAPVSQFPDADVVCTDTSTNNPTDWYWTLDYDALGIKAWQTSTSQNFTWQSHYNGLFSVNLRANNSAGNSWYNRSEYVLISNNASPMTPETPIPAGYIRSKVQCVDSQNSATIQSCYISIQDKEAGTWSNGSWYGTYFIDTLPAHHIDAYGTATGYTDTSRLNLPASGLLTYELLMFPGYAPAAAAGNVWLYVLVNDMSTGAALPSAQVQISSSGLTSQSKLTGISGQASFEVANDTVWHVTASRSGYQTMAEVITTSHLGPDTLRIELPRTTTTPTVTGTVLPGEVTVRPTQDPALNPDGSYPSGYSAVKGQEMMNWLAANGFDLVQLCFLVTILGLLGVSLGK